MFISPLLIPRSSSVVFFAAYLLDSNFTAGISRISQKIVQKRSVSIVPSFQKTLFIKAEIVSAKVLFRGRAVVDKRIFPK